MRDDYKPNGGQCCPTCNHVFIRDNYDEGCTYFCRLGAPPRPICMAFAIWPVGENDGDENQYELLRKNEEAFNAVYEAWNNWSTAREVGAGGICSSFRCRTRL